MRLRLKPRWALAAGSLAAVATLTLMLGQERAAAQDPGLAKRVEGILKTRCFKCHGQGGPAARDVYVMDRESLVEKTRVVVPKDPNSKLIKLVEVGGMPPGGPKLPPAEIKALKDWVMAGAPVAGTPAVVAPSPGGGTPESPDLHAGNRRRTEFIDEVEVLKLIQADQQKQLDELTRRNYRYYSIVHLYNNPDYSDEEINAFRLALSKLVNSLSWNPRIHPPVAIDPNKLILRIDLRDYSWTPAIWKRLIASYPYGVIYRDTEVFANAIAANSGADPKTFVPYIRADWFVAHACVPPLYNQVLELPERISDLEALLKVDVKRNIAEQHDVLRAGMRTSGVSHNNRVVERHVSQFGAYWKSYDFASNSSAAKKNIFANPMQFVEDGGEFIWNLPNGMQAYMIVDKTGKSIPIAPIEIVQDGTNRSDPTVRTGRSCMGCHIQGMREARDQIRSTLLTMGGNTPFDVDDALALYKPQGEVDRALKEDSDRFRNAVRASGGDLPAVPEIEPISALANKYQQELNAIDAAAEVGMKVRDFQAVLVRSQNLVQNLGFGQLLAPDPHAGGIKRDLWEENFATMIKDLRLSRVAVRAEQPEQPLPTAQPAADPRKTVSVGELQADRSDPQAVELKDDLRKQLSFWLSQSKDLKVVQEKADIPLKGRVVVKKSQGQPDQVLVSLGDPGSGQQQEVTGPKEEAPFLAQQLANKVNFDLTRNWLPVPSANDPRLKTDEREIVRQANPLQELEAPPSPAPPGAPARGEKLVLSVDRGAEATYFVGESLQVRVKADRDCFVWIYNRDTNGNMVRLYPNQLTKGPNRVKANTILAFPEEGEWMIQPDDPRKGRGDGLGLESLIAVATLEPGNPFPEVPEADLVEDPAKPGPGPTGKPISIGAKRLVIAVKEKQQAGQVYAQTQVQFQTAPRSPRDLPR